MTLKVGSIVICHGWEVIENLKGFIDEIVSDPEIEHTGLIWSGNYSVYGLEKAHFYTADKYYFGDFLGVNLEETGKSMTVEDLEKFAKNDPENKMLQLDIPIIIKNLGREMGKNIGRIEMEKISKDG